MYLFKNAWKNLFRNKGRYFLIFLVFLLMVTGGTTCAIIRTATQQAIASAQKTLPVKVTGSEDFMKEEKDSVTSQETLIDGTVRYKTISRPNTEISVDQMKTLASSPLVDHSLVDMVAPVYSPTLQCVDNGNALDVGLDQYYGSDKQTLYQLVEKIYAQKYEYYASDAFKTSALFLTLYGTDHQLTEDEIRELSARTVFGDTLYQQYMADQTLNDDLVNEALAIYSGWENDNMIDELTSAYAETMALWASTGENTDFSGGANVITEGRMPEKVNECAVGSLFAAMNNLSIGSKISLMSPKKADTRTMELTVCGIYKEVAWEATHNLMEAPDPNNLYVAPETIYNATLEEKFTSPFGVEFFLKSADDVEEFQELMRANGYNEYYNLKSNLAAREEAMEPLRKVSSLMNVILIAVLALGGIIFLLLTFFAVRERKYEIGVLRAIGMKKKSVIRGFLYETLIIVLICCVLGMTVGTFASQPILDMMMNTQTTAETPAATSEPVAQTMPDASDEAAAPDAAGAADNTAAPDAAGAADEATAPDAAGAADEAAAPDAAGAATDATTDENGNKLGENGNVVGNVSGMMMGGNDVLTMDENGNFVDQDGNPVSSEGMTMGGSDMLTMDENGNLVDQNGNPVSGEGMTMGGVAAADGSAPTATSADGSAPAAAAAGTEDTPEYSYSGSSVEVMVDEDGNQITTGGAAQEKLEVGDVRASLNWQTIALILGVALLLAALAVVIAGWYITKFEPIKILSDQE